MMVFKPSLSFTANNEKIAVMGSNKSYTGATRNVYERRHCVSSLISVLPSPSKLKNEQIFWARRHLMASCCYVSGDPGFLCW